MPDANHRVIALLRDSGFPTSVLRVATEPGSHGQSVTTIRPSRPADSPWSATTAAGLAATLRSLPHADVRLRPIVDRIVVLWTND